MIVLAKHLRAFERDSAVAECGSFGAARDDTDVEGHGFTRSREKTKFSIANFQLPILQANFVQIRFRTPRLSANLWF
jgi:hypothetical protein